MKWIIATILTAVSIAAFCALVVPLSEVTQKDWASTTLWFVVPVGGFVVGIGLALVERFSKTDGGLAVLAFGILGGLASWIAVNVSFYEVGTHGLIRFTDWVALKAWVPSSIHDGLDGVIK